jgi:putative redox protein
MATEFSVRAVRQEGMRLITGNGRYSIGTHYPRGVEQATGLTPLEVLLSSLAVCLGGSMVGLLSRTQQPVTRIEASASGERRDEHPTCCSRIHLEVLVRRAGVDPAAVDHALQLSEKAICPVWAMLKDGTQISASFRIVE